MAYSHSGNRSNYRVSTHAGAASRQVSYQGPPRDSRDTHRSNHPYDHRRAQSNPPPPSDVRTRNSSLPVPSLNQIAPYDRPTPHGSAPPPHDRCRQTEYLSLFGKDCIRFGPPPSDPELRSGSLPRGCVIGKSTTSSSSRSPFYWKEWLPLADQTHAPEQYTSHRDMTSICILIPTRVSETCPELFEGLQLATKLCLEATDPRTLAQKAQARAIQEAISPLADQISSVVAQLQPLASNPDTAPPPTPPAPRDPSPRPTPTPAPPPQPSPQDRPPGYFAAAYDPLRDPRAPPCTGETRVGTPFCDPGSCFWGDHPDSLYGPQNPPPFPDFQALFDSGRYHNANATSTDPQLRQACQRIAAWAAYRISKARAQQAESAVQATLDMPAPRSVPRKVAKKKATAPKRRVQPLPSGEQQSEPPRQRQQKRPAPPTSDEADDDPGPDLDPARHFRSLADEDFDQYEPEDDFETPEDDDCDPPPKPSPTKSSTRSSTRSHQSALNECHANQLKQIYSEKVKAALGDRKAKISLDLFRALFSFLSYPFPLPDFEDPELVYGKSYTPKVQLELLGHAVEAVLAHEHRHKLPPLSYDLPTSAELNTLMKKHRTRHPRPPPSPDEDDASTRPRRSAAKRN